MIVAKRPAMAGSSPHVRGALRSIMQHHELRGIIPACAGSTAEREGFEPPNRDHPRMCGEHRRTQSGSRRGQGSSPHVRGALHPSSFFMSRTGIIPACAGSTSLVAWSVFLSRDHPRMCGEHKLHSSIVSEYTGSSPHVRGAQPPCLRYKSSVGIIPACAGSTNGFNRG